MSDHGIAESIHQDACTVAKKDACTVAKKDVCTAVSQDACTVAKKDVCPVAKKDACPVAKKDARTVAKKDACIAVKKDVRAADKEDFAVTAQKKKKEPPEYVDVEDSLQEAIVEMLIARKAQARVRTVQGQPVTAAGQEFMAISDRRRQMFEERNKFFEDNPRTQACCQYDCRQRTRYRSDIAFVHGGVLRCIVTRVALVIPDDKGSASSGQQTTRRLATLEELKSKQDRRREWYQWHGKNKPHVAAHVFRQFEWEQRQLEAWEKEKDKQMKEPQRSAGEHQECDRPTAHTSLFNEVTGSPCPGHEHQARRPWQASTNVERAERVAVRDAATVDNRPVSRGRKDRGVRPTKAERQRRRLQERSS